METKVANPDFEFIHADKRSSTFFIKNVDVSIVNSIRRAIQANVNTVAFYFDPKSSHNTDIDIVQNDSPLHNEFLAQRFSMVPIHFEKHIIDDWNEYMYSFKIDVSNDSLTSFKNVTTKDIIVYYENGSKVSDATRDTIFPKNDTTGDYILLTKLPPVKDPKIPTQLKVNLRCSKDSGSKSSCFSPTSLCVFSNACVENAEMRTAEEAFVAKYRKQFESAHDINKQTTKQEKENQKETDIFDKIERDARMKFKTIEYQREFKKNIHGEPNEFKFSIDSECALTPEDIFTEAIDYLVSRVESLREKIHKGSTTIKTVGEDKYELLVDHETHTLGNLIQAFFYNEFIRESKEDDASLSFIGYFLTHPLEQLICFKMVSKLSQSEFTSFFTSGLDAMKAKLLEFRAIWEERVKAALSEKK